MEKEDDDDDDGSPVATAAIPPMVEAVSPAAGSSNVSISSLATVFFSKTMAESSITAGTFRLADASGNSVPGTIEVHDVSADFTPTARLNRSIQYTATVTTGATDADGTAMAADHIWTFTSSSTHDCMSCSGEVWSITDTPVSNSCDSSGLRVANRSQDYCIVVSGSSATTQDCTGGGDLTNTDYANGVVSITNRPISFDFGGLTATGTITLTWTMSGSDMTGDSSWS